MKNIVYVILGILFFTQTVAAYVSYPLSQNEVIIAERVVDVVEQKIAAGDLTTETIVNILDNYLEDMNFAHKNYRILRYTMNDLQNDVFCSVVSGKPAGGYDGVFSCGLFYTLEDGGRATIYDPSGKVLMTGFPLKYFCGDVCTRSIITNKNFSHLTRSENAFPTCGRNYAYKQYNTKTNSYDFLIQLSYPHTGGAGGPHNLLVQKGDDVLTANFFPDTDEEERSFDGLSYTVNGTEKLLYAVEPQNMRGLICGYSYEEQVVDYPNTYFLSFQYPPYTTVDTLFFEDNFAIMTLDLENLVFDVQMK